MKEEVRMNNQFSVYSSRWRGLSLLWFCLVIVWQVPAVARDYLFIYKGNPIFIPEELMGSRSFSIAIPKLLLEKDKEAEQEADAEEEAKPEDTQPPKVAEEPPVEEPPKPESIPEEEFPEDALAENPTEDPSKKPKKDPPDYLPPEKKETDVGKLMLRAYTAFKNGRLERSMDFLKEAETLAPNHPSIKTMKGSIYYKLGVIDKAKKAWTESLRINPNQKKVRDYLKRIGGNPDAIENDGPPQQQPQTDEPPPTEEQNNEEIEQTEPPEQTEDI